MLVEVGWPLAVGLSAVAWALLSMAFGRWAARRPAERFTGEGPVLRLRTFEAGGRWYARRLGIRRWKDRLPEAGTWFGGVSKRALPPAPDRRARLDRFVHECARAETVHWLLLAASLLFGIWCPPWLWAVMVGFAVVANVPCLLVQRYNRARLAAALARRA